MGSLHPLEADPPLIVDPDAVLTFSVRRQSLQVITGNPREVLTKWLRIRGCEAVFQLDGGNPRKQEFVRPEQNVGISCPCNSGSSDSLPLYT